MMNKSIDKMISQGRKALPCNIMQTNQGPVSALKFVKLKNMFKQHVNLMIWTWILAATNSFEQQILWENPFKNENAPLDLWNCSENSVVPLFSYK